MESLTPEQQWMREDKKRGNGPDATRLDRLLAFFRPINVERELRHVAEGVRLKMIPIFRKNVGTVDPDQEAAFRADIINAIEESANLRVNR